jgi:hypothetical protein
MDVPFCPDAMNTLHGVPCLAGPCDGVGRKRPRREIAAESPGGRPPKRPVRDIALTDDSDRFDRCQQVQSDDDKKKDSDGEDDGCLYDLAWTLIVEHALASTRVDLIAARVRDALSLALTCRTLYATVQRLRVRFDRLRARMGPLDGADWVSLVPWTETIDVVYGLSMYCKWEGPRALGPAPRVTLPTLPSVALLAPREDDTTGVWYELATGVLCAAPLRPGTRDAPGEGAPSTGSEDSGDDEEDYVRGESHLVCRLKMPVVEYIEDWTWWESAGKCPIFFLRSFVPPKTRIFNRGIPSRGPGIFRTRRMPKCRRRRQRGPTYHHRRRRGRNGRRGGR